MQPMYRGIPFSPRTALTAAIGEADTVILVGDVSAFPSAPSYATIGADESAETILYTAVTDGALSGCTRGVEGAARAWGAGETIARNFTAADHEALIENTENLDTALAAHAKDAVSHIACVATEGTSEAYTAVVPGITGLTVGMLLTIIPHMDCTSRSPTLDVNETGAIPLTRRSSARVTTSSAAIVADWLIQNEPALLQYTGSRWIALDRTKPSASDLDGKVEILRGGTGKTVWDENKLVCMSDSKAFDQVPFPTENGGFLRQDTSGAPYWSNSGKALTDIGAAPAEHTHTKTEITDFPALMPPAPHKASHASGGTDALTPADIGAATVAHTHTAAQVGARPDTWVPTATEVGAAATNHTHTAEQIGARPDTWTPTVAEVGAAASSHTHTATDVSGLSGTDYTTSRVRGISAGTTDLTAGTSNLESGTIYLVYE